MVEDEEQLAVRDDTVEGVDALRLRGRDPLVAEPESEQQFPQGAAAWWARPVPRRPRST